MFCWFKHTIKAVFCIASSCLNETPTSLFLNNSQLFGFEIEGGREGPVLSGKKFLIGIYKQQSELRTPLFNS